MPEQNLTIPVALSARHVHLSQEHVEALFGPGYQLRKLSDLSQPGQYACHETVEVLGPKRSVSKVRVLGPARSATQVELSTTDGVVLGIRLPIRDSGDTKGTPGAHLIGPRGAVKLQEGCIVASRHIHTTPEDAARLGVVDNQKVWVQFVGPRGLVFSDVLVRVSPSFKTELHPQRGTGPDPGQSLPGSVRSPELRHLRVPRPRREPALLPVDLRRPERPVAACTRTISTCSFKPSRTWCWPDFGNRSRPG